MRSASSKKVVNNVSSILSTYHGSHASLKKSLAFDIKLSGNISQRIVTRTLYLNYSESNLKL